MCWDCLDWLQCANVEDAGGIVSAACGDVVPIIQCRIFSLWCQEEGKSIASLPVWREIHRVDCKYVPVEVHGSFPCSEVPHSTNGIKATTKFQVVSSKRQKESERLTRKQREIRRLDRRL